jgi:DNA-binding XRE family transcriptional regulator
MRWQAREPRLSHPDGAGTDRCSHLTDAGCAPGSYHDLMAAETVGSQSELAFFLKTRRRSIPPDSVTLGPWERLPIRHGRRVTQEEIAEAIGISRNWYRRLESNEAPRPSAKLLDRIAKAFQFTPEERTNLFVLGIPELAPIRAI